MRAAEPSAASLSTTNVPPRRFAVPLFHFHFSHRERITRARRCPRRAVCARIRTDTSPHYTLSLSISCLPACSARTPSRAIGSLLTTTVTYLRRSQHSPSPRLIHVELRRGLTLSRRTPRTLDFNSILGYVLGPRYRRAEILVISAVQKLRETKS